MGFKLLEPCALLLFFRDGGLDCLESPLEFRLSVRLAARRGEAQESKKRSRARAHLYFFPVLKEWIHSSVVKLY
jgi:hypothetical protein